MLKMHALVPFQGGVQEKKFSAYTAITATIKVTIKASTKSKINAITATITVPITAILLVIQTAS